MSPSHSTRKGTKRYRYYVCTKAQKRGWHNCPSKSIPAPEIERFVVEQIKAVGHDPAFLREVVDQARIQAESHLTHLDAEQRSLERDLARWNAEVRRLVPQIRRGDAESPAVARLADLQDRIRAAERRERYAGRMMAYPFMPNHWHFVLQRTKDGGMSNFLRWVSLTHTMRLQAHDGTGGQGDVYQGRLKRFPVQDDEHFLLDYRYVERNALRAELVRRAEDWTWGSRNRWREEPLRKPRLRSAWPIARSPRWAERVNKPLTAAELKAVRTSINRGSPLGDGNEVQAISRHLNRQSTLRPRGRPQKRVLTPFPRS